MPGLLGCIYSVVIIVYVLYIIKLFRKYGIIILGDPLVLMLIVNFLYVLLPNFELFGINPFGHDPAVKSNTDKLSILVSIILLISSITVQMLDPWPCLQSVSVSMPRNFYLLATCFFLIGLIYFVAQYLINLTLLLSVDFADRRQLLDESLKVSRFWIFGGLFFISSIVLSFQFKSELGTFLFLMVTLGILTGLPIVSGYRILITHFFLFTFLFLIMRFSYKSLYPLLFLFFAIGTFLGVALIRGPEGYLNVSLLHTTLGEFIFVRQSLDIAYEKLYSSSDIGSYLMKTLLHAVPGFLRWREIVDMDPLLAANYYYGPQSGLAALYFTEGIYYGGYYGFLFALFLLLFFVLISRFLIIRSKKLVLFLLGLYILSHMFFVFRSGSALFVNVAFSFLVFTFWVQGKVSRRYER